jgi:hypothetical protein
VIALLAACGNPLLDDPPELVTLNGELPHEIYGWQLFPEESPMEIFLEARDPDGGEVTSWWPWSPEGFRWDPYANAGVWDLGADLPYNLDVVLEDRNGTTASFSVSVVWGDSG